MMGIKYYLIMYGLVTLTPLNSDDFIIYFIGLEVSILNELFCVLHCKKNVYETTTHFDMISWSNSFEDFLSDKYWIQVYIK